MNWFPSHFGSARRMECGIDVAVIAIYLIGITALGIWAGYRRNASTEQYFLASKSFGWFTVGAAVFTLNISTIHLVGLAAGGAGITLSNADCSFIKLGNSSIVDGVSRLDTKTPQLQVLAGGQIDAPAAGIPKQGGDSHFLQRFALQTHGGYDATAAMKFALEHQNPPVTGWLRAGGTLPDALYSYCSVSNPNVLLWVLKPAEDRPIAGVVARLWNLSDSPVEALIKFTSGINSACRTTHLETDMEPVSLSADKSLPTKFAQQQLQTYRVRTTAKEADKK